MEIIRDIFDYESGVPCVVSVGKFDGVHKGHMLLREHMKRYKAAGLIGCMVTFDIPPADEIDHTASKLLITANEREAIIKKSGIERLCILHFDERMRHMSPENFIHMLMDRLSMRAMVVGEDFRFGYKGMGDAVLLSKLADEYDFELEVVKKLQDEDRDISSTMIRELIADGALSHANELLGYDYFVYGNIVHGNHIGHKIDFPTINIVPPADKLLPPNGVYITRVTMEDRTYAAVTNVGCKPTVSSTGEIVVESHLLEGGGDFYGENARVSFLSFLRKEMKFDNLDDLKRQIASDKKSALAYFDK